MCVVLWLRQFFWVEPATLLDGWLGTTMAGDEQRILSWQSRAPVFTIIGQRLPRTLTVVGTAYLIGIMIALPIGIYSAYRQYSWFDQLGTFIAMVGFSVPTFFTGTVIIIIFAIWLGWFPTKYDTTLTVTDWASFKEQLRQMAMPVMTLGLANAAAISRYMRSSMLENMSAEYVRTARAKGMSERVVVLKHVLRNSLIPVVTVIALGIPAIFGGAIITESVLSFLGLGFPPDFPTWGRLLYDGLSYIQTSPERVVWPGLAISLTVLSVNYIGDGLRDALDPRIRGR